jgi:hypothetical protein
VRGAISELFVYRIYNYISTSLPLQRPHNPPRRTRRRPIDRQRANIIADVSLHAGDTCSDGAEGEEDDAGEEAGVGEGAVGEGRGGGG